MLVDVPLLDVAAPAAEQLMLAAPDRLATLIEGARRRYGKVVMTLGDRATLAWLRRSRSPCLPEIEAVARRLGEPGAALLNMSYEWSCTAGIAAAASGTGMRLLRTLDWPLPGLGRAVVVARQHGAAGDYYSVTWPGYVGVLTGMAPGRFCAAINQPPLRRVSRLRPLDWIIARQRLWRSRELPPSHLLRRVFDECANYTQARRMLIETPLCAPAFYSLAGIHPGEGCVIERRETAAAVRPAPAAVANHWTGFAERGHDRGYDSRGRQRDMECALQGGGGGDFAWLQPSVLNPTTRLAVIADAAECVLIVQGWESDGPATHVLSLPSAAATDA